MFNVFYCEEVELGMFGGANICDYIALITDLSEKDVKQRIIDAKPTNENMLRVIREVFEDIAINGSGVSISRHCAALGLEETNFLGENSFYDLTYLNEEQLYSYEMFSEIQKRKEERRKLELEMEKKEREIRAKEQEELLKKKELEELKRLQEKYGSQV